MTEKRQLRVLHLHSGNMLGGVESVLLTFAEYAGSCPELLQEFALTFNGEFAKALRNTGSAVHILPEAHLSDPFSVARSRRALRELLARKSFDCVISHSTWCQVMLAPAVKSSRTPLIFWMHNNFDGHWLQRLAARHQPAFAICNSRYTLSTLASVYPRTQAHIIHYPVRPLPTTIADRTRIREELEVPPGTVTILMASRTEAWKGHFNLLRAAAQINTTKDWKIWIAGGPQTEKERKYFASVQAEAKLLQLDQKVRFLGYRNDVPALIRGADIFCQPNADPEPFGVVFVEALQAGVPIVTFRMGGPQEILTENSGILVPPGDISMLADGLRRLIEDESLRSRLGVQGPARAKELCDPTRQLDRVCEVIRGHLQQVAH